MIRFKFENRKDLYIFYIFCSIGFFIDGYFNNSNFLVLFFLFSSYRAFKKDKKWLAGIFFTLAVFKINAILFLPLLCLGPSLGELIFYGFDGGLVDFGDGD